MDTDATDDDLQLVLDAQKGDADAFRRLVLRYQRRAYKVALGVLRNGDDAQEVVQETFLRVHRNLKVFDGRSRFTTWLHRIVINLSIDHLRRRRAVRLDVDVAHALDADARNLPAPLELDPSRRIASRELRGRLDAALAQLSPAHRTVLLLREVEDLSYKEIAVTVGISLGTVMSRLFHARKRMQRLLENDEEIALALAA
jgi:RNA polymerase sigma-70 factor (ECF subfamily)